MKQLAIAALLVLAAGSASAVEVGVSTSRDYSGADRNGLGVTVGESFGQFGVTAGFERFTRGPVDQDRYSVIGSYTAAKVGMVSVSALGGGAYLDNQRGANGYALVYGVGASLPVAKNVTAGVALTRQVGQDRVQSSDGNKLTASVKYSF